MAIRTKIKTNENYVRSQYALNLEDLSACALMRRVQKQIVLARLKMRNVLRVDGNCVIQAEKVRKHIVYKNIIVHCIYTSKATEIARIRTVGNL